MNPNCPACTSGHGPCVRWVLPSYWNMEINTDISSLDLRLNTQLPPKSRYRHSRQWEFHWCDVENLDWGILIDQLLGSLWFWACWRKLFFFFFFFFFSWGWSGADCLSVDLWRSEYTLSLVQVCHTCKILPREWCREAQVFVVKLWFLYKFSGMRILETPAPFCKYSTQQGGYLSHFA